MFTQLSAALHNGMTIGTFFSYAWLPLLVFGILYLMSRPGPSMPVVNVGKATVKVTFDTLEEARREFTGHAHHSQAFGTFTHTAYAKATEWIRESDPIEVTPKTFYGRKRVHQYEIVDETVYEVQAKKL